MLVFCRPVNRVDSMVPYHGTSLKVVKCLCGRIIRMNGMRGNGLCSYCEQLKETDPAMYARLLEAKRKERLVEDIL